MVINFKEVHYKKCYIYFINRKKTKNTRELKLLSGEKK